MRDAVGARRRARAARGAARARTVLSTLLHLAWEYPPRIYGGLGRHLEGLGRALAAAGQSVTVVTPAWDEPTPPGPVRVVRAPAPPTALPPEQWIAAVLEAGNALVVAARTEIARRPPDVVHAHDWMVGHAAREVAAAHRLPLVVTIHSTERGRHQGHLPTPLSEWIDGLERELVAAAAAVIVCSTWMRELAVASLGVAASGVAVIPNAVDASAWRIASAPRSSGPIVVFAGRLEYEKGLDVLLDAFARLRRTQRDARLRIAGDGTYAAVVRKRAARFDGAVELLGRLDQPQLAAEFAAADVVAVPSLYEPFGLVALEAMAAGTPVVAARTGGLAETIRDARDGLLVPAGDAVALAAGLSRVLGDRGLATRLADAGRAHAARRPWAAAAEATAAVYARVVSR